MVILHIACIQNDPCSGVCVVVPQHINAQSKFADIGFINVNNEKIEGITKQFEYRKPFNITKLPKPFDRPDLVAFQETYRKDYLYISGQLRKLGIPYITIPHGELAKEAQQKKWLKKKTANFLLFNRFVDGAAAVQCLSQRECDTTHFGRKKIIATNGMDVPEIQKKDFSSQGLKLLFIGRLDIYHKGLDLMIEAFRMKSDFLREHKCTLEIYGPDCDGGAARLTELIQNAGIGDIVRQYGLISGPAKEAKLLDCDVFIQTSRFEGMPLGILEAMSYGIPCLVTEGTTVGDIIVSNDAGWCAQNDDADIAAMICKAYGEKERFEIISQNAAAAAKSLFSWEKIAEETVEQYSLLLK